MECQRKSWWWRCRAWLLSSSFRPTRCLESPRMWRKKAVKEKIIDLYNKVFDEGLITSEADREVVRLAKDLELKTKMEDEKKAKAEAEGPGGDSRLPIEVEAGVFEDASVKKFTINVTKKNKEGRCAYKGQVVRLNYTGKLEDGTVFDSTMDAEFLRNKNMNDGKTYGGKGVPSQRGSALQFKIGSNQVIRGWDECIKEMKQGECASVTVEPEWGYGTKGSMNQTTGGKLNPVWPYLHSSIGVPPNARLFFELEIVSLV
mmetsp:Transcript_28362/g.23800  ORF Transcript_28362/g.23800 Transcript_28362/m.23800 type:complete len:259 (+) Transcript_28362:25-801(+)